MPVTVCEFESRPGHSENGLQAIASHFSFLPRPHHDRKSVILFDFLSFLALGSLKSCL